MRARILFALLLSALLFAPLNAQTSASYGSVTAVSLANTTEPLGQSFEFDFTPPVTFTADTLRLFFITPAQQAANGKTGYALGTGGNYIAAIWFAPGDAEFVAIGNPVVWFVGKFQKPRQFTAGQNYVFYVFNIDPSPALNYSSLDSLLTKGSLPGLTVNMTCAYWYNGTRTVRTGYLPIFSLENSADATQHFGMGYMEVESSYFQTGRIWQQVIPATKISGYSYRTSTGLATVTFDAPQTVSTLSLGADLAVLVRKGTQQGYPDPLPGAHAQYSDDGGKTWVTPSLPVDAQFSVAVAN